MSAADRLRVLEALLRAVKTDATASGVPGRHVLLALAAHAKKWAEELEER